MVSYHKIQLTRVIAQLSSIHHIHISHRLVAIFFFLPPVLSLFMSSQYSWEAFFFSFLFSTGVSSSRIENWSTSGIKCQWTSWILTWLMIQVSYNRWMTSLLTGRKSEKVRELTTAWKRQGISGEMREFFLQDISSVISASAIHESANNAWVPISLLRIPRSGDCSQFSKSQCKQK